MSLPFLQTIGLTQKEADLYELLLKLGEVSANTLIRETDLKRATAYKSLYALEQKGLVTKRDIGKIIHFRPEQPTKLLELAEREVQNTERAKEDLRTILPQLTSSYILTVEKPVISTYEGVNGLKEIYEDTLRERKPIYAVLQTAEVNDELYQWLTKKYVKSRAKLGIKAQVIVASGKWSREYIKKDEGELRESILVPSREFPFQHEVDIYGDKVAFLNYKKGEALIGVLIKHPQIAQTMKAWFDLAWEGATRLSSATPSPVDTTTA